MDSGSFDTSKSNLLDVGLMTLGFVYLMIYSYEVLGFPSSTTSTILDICSQIIFVIFAVDVLFKLFMTRTRLTTFEGWIKYLRENWLGILALLAPMLRSLAILRLLVVLRGIAPFISSRVSKIGFYVGIALPLVIYTASLSVLEAERGNPEANILNFSDAVWWSLVTVTTVGFGDIYPVTQDGRTVGSFLIFVGIALFSTLTALIASWVLSEKK